MAARRCVLQWLANLTRLLRAQLFRAIADSNHLLKLGIKQTAKLKADALQAVMRSMLPGINVRSPFTVLLSCVMAHHDYPL